MEGHWASLLSSSLVHGGALPLLVSLMTNISVALQLHMALWTSSENTSYAQHASQELFCRAREQVTVRNSVPAALQSCVLVCESMTGSGTSMPFWRHGYV